MRFRPAGGLDLTTGALILGGASLIAVSIVAAALLFAPPASTVPQAGAPSANPRAAERPSAALDAQHVAAVLNVDVGAGAGVAARAGDRIDVLGFFSRQITGAEAVTRVLVRDAPVLAVDRNGGSVALTLEVTPTAALLLQEAQALGARPFVALRSAEATADLPAGFSDSELAQKVARAPER
jgi:hypothetical protein